MRPKFVKKTIGIEVAKGIKFTATFSNSSNLLWAFLQLNIFILYLVDYCVDFGIDLYNNELKYSSETSAKRDSAAIVLVFSLLMGYNVWPSSHCSSTNQNAAFEIDHWSD